VVLAELGRARAGLCEAECGCARVCVGDFLGFSVSLCCWPAASTLHLLLALDPGAQATANGSAARG
jgi:hypothetical protein